MICNNCKSEMTPILEKIGTRTNVICPNCKTKNGEFDQELEEMSFKNTIQQHLILKERDEATELLSSRLQQTNKFYTTRFDDKSEMYCYKEGIYVPEGKTVVREYVRRIVGAAYTEQLANRVISKIEADTYIEQKDFLKRHYKDLICVKNGILNLKTKELTAFNPDQIFLTKINAVYNPEAKCSSIDLFLSSCLPDENDVKTIEEWFGYCLLGGYEIQKIALFIGAGGNGKGQTLDLGRKLLGDNNYCGIPLQKLEESDFKEYELFNKLANIGADISDRPLKETAKIKGLSGGDSINASVKFKNDLTFTNEAKLIFSANKLPKTYDLTEAFFRRWIYIVFPYRFMPLQEFNKLPDDKKKLCKVACPEVIKQIASDEELSGFLNKCLSGLDRLFLNKDFTSSKSNEETRLWWIRNSDSLLAFCYEELVEDGEALINKDAFRKAYQKYCRDNKLPAESDVHIKETLTRQFRAWDYQETEGERVWGGIKLKS